MEESKSILVKNCWVISALGTVAELRHEMDGLQGGLVVRSLTNGREWRVKARIIFSHTLGRQKEFPGETVANSFLSFSSLEKQAASAEGILRQEADRIFQYQLQPVGHNERLRQGELLQAVTLMRFACPCCGYKTLNEPASGTYSICRVCFWEDDLFQLNNPDEVGGANRVSLRQAQQNFRTFGASEQEMIKNVRPPDQDEARDTDWKWQE